MKHTHPSSEIHVKRVYDAPAASDGRRVLVDRIWPRGVSKDEAKLDLWLKEVAPSTELRTWFGHDPAKWAEFRAKYREELAAQPGAVEALVEACRVPKTTLVFAAKDEAHNNAVVLKALVEERLRGA